MHNSTPPRAGASPSSKLLTTPEKVKIFVSDFLLTPTKTSPRQEHLESLCKNLGLTISKSGLFSTSTTIIDNNPPPIIGTAKIALLEHLCFCHRWINILGQAREILIEPFTPSHNTNILIDLTVEILKKAFTRLTDDNARQCAINLITLVTHDNLESNKDTFPKIISPLIIFLQDGKTAKLELNNLPPSHSNHSLYQVCGTLQVKNTADMTKVSQHLKNLTSLNTDDDALINKMYGKELKIPTPKKKSLGQFLTIFRHLRPFSSQIKDLDFKTDLNDFNPTKVSNNLNESQNALASLILKKCKKNNLTVGDFLEDFALTYPYTECFYLAFEKNIDILAILISYCKYDPDPTPEKFKIILPAFDTFLIDIGTILNEHQELIISLFSSYYLYHENSESIEKLKISSKDYLAKTSGNIPPHLREICNIDFATQEKISANELEQIMLLAIINKDVVMQNPTKGGHLFSKSLTGLNHAILLFNNNGVYTVLIKPNVHNNSKDWTRFASGGEKHVKLQGIEITLDDTLRKWQYQRVVTVSQLRNSAKDHMQQYVQVNILKSIKPTDKKSATARPTDTEPIDIGRPIFYTKYLGKPLKDIFSNLAKEQQDNILLQLYQKFQLSYKDIKIDNVLIDDENNLHFIDYDSSSITYTVRDYSLLPSNDAINKNAILGLCTIFFKLCNFDNLYMVNIILEKVSVLNILTDMPTKIFDENSSMTLMQELRKACEGKLTLDELGAALQKLYPDVNFVRTPAPQEQ